MCYNHRAFFFLFFCYLDVDGGALAFGGAVCGRDGDWLATSLFRQADELAEHQFAGLTGEFVDVGGGEVCGGDGGQDC